MLSCKYNSSNCVHFVCILSAFMYEIMEHLKSLAEIWSNPHWDMIEWMVNIAWDCDWKAKTGNIVNRVMLNKKEHNWILENRFEVVLWVGMELCPLNPHSLSLWLLPSPSFFHGTDLLNMPAGCQCWLVDRHLSKSHHYASVVASVQSAWQCNVLT
jgi:hypothetical protein